MNKEDNYIEINRESWNNKTETHLKSEFYDLDNFIKGKTSLNSIELDLLGDVKGKTILHLQCHFGQDSISLSRLGAEVTGIDLSDKAIQSAKQIAKDTNSKANFICCNIYDLPNHLDKQFDIVYTSYGTIGWLPDLDKWARIVSQYVKPNGQFVHDALDRKTLIGLANNLNQLTRYAHQKKELPVIIELLNKINKIFDS